MLLGSSHELIIVSSIVVFISLSLCYPFGHIDLSIGKVDQVKSMEHDSFALELWDLFSYRRVTFFFRQICLQN